MDGDGGRLRVFAGLFLLAIGAVMVAGTVRGIRRGRIMTLIRRPDQGDELFARPGEAGYRFFAVCWFAGGAVVLYHGLRLLWQA